jgi:CheY-like chemotaxis protein
MIGSLCLTVASRSGRVERGRGYSADTPASRIPGTPIIAMTANAFAGDKANCFEAGMNDFLAKPFNPDQLFAILFRALDQNRSGAFQG